MPIPSFTPNYPPNNSTLGQTKAVIRDNLDGTFQAFSIDHQDQNESNPGYHADIHMVPQGTWNSTLRTGAPAPIAGIDQVVALNWTPGFAGATADTQLFNVSGSGGVSQLTGNQAANEGWSWMGGMLLQWGTVTSTLSSGSVSFTARSAQGIDFPTAAFSVVCTHIVTNFAAQVSTVYVKNLTTTGFDWFQTTVPPNQTGFYWIAIGA